uniref:Uncharacterized protein n=1 Tax=viral metagenome TaxID=1070528 RepID=A0A6C0LGM4_9ZZZZ
MDNLDNSTKRKNTKERVSNTTNDSPFVTPSSSPTIEPNTEQIKVPIIDNKLNNYKLPVNHNEKDQEIKKDESTYMDISLDTLILNLKIISKLKPGYKLSLKENDGQLSDIYIDTSYFQYIYRIFSDNSRDHTTNFLEILDKDITKKIEELVKEDNYNDTNMFLNSKENILLNLSHNLNLSLVGLNNLINTYANDEYTISKFEMIINNFELKIRKISNILKVNN